MTGPEHYREAERLLKAFDEFDITSPREVPTIGMFLAEAQVHATLALAAAAAFQPARGVGEDAWREVTA